METRHSISGIPSDSIARETRMLTLSGNAIRCCERIGRRDFLHIGALGFTSLPHVLRAQAATGTTSRQRSVILIHLTGGPSQLDSYDLKPDAPVEYRGEFHPIATSVPGIEICELMPMQARIMDKLIIIRDMQFHNELPFDHDPHEVFSGYAPKHRRPPLGSLVSRLRPPESQAIPPYISLCKHKSSISERLHPEDPLYAGTGHRPFAPISRDMENLQVLLPEGRLNNRRELLDRLDRLQRRIDQTGEIRGMDEFNQRALAMTTSSSVLAALDVSREPDHVRERYGPDRNYPFNTFPGQKPVLWQASRFLAARRLAEAGVPVITMNIGEWDHHGVLSNGPQSDIVTQMKLELPWFDQAITALVMDLEERGLLDDVMIVALGEMGRTPKINHQAGRDHWQNSGFALMAGGGLRAGQVIGATDKHAAAPRGNPHTPEHLFGMMYRHLGINPATTVPDFSGRPRQLVDDDTPIHELL